MILLPRRKRSRKRPVPLTGKPEILSIHRRHGPTQAGDAKGRGLSLVIPLVRKFLKQFRPDDCWSLTWSETCSKPRVGQFGGGAVFVTASDVAWGGSCDFVEQQRAVFASSGADDPYHLTIDGPAFRQQRELLQRLRGFAAAKMPYWPAPGEPESLDGLIGLTDEMADQAHDNHRVDCLLDTGADGP